MLERLGERHDKPLFALELREFRLPDAPLELPTRHFLCLLAADFTKASDGEISRLAQSLLDRGASYFVCWGAGCERAHALIDDVTLLLAPPIFGDSVVMTTWHAGVPIDDALLHLLSGAWPDPAFEDSTGCSVAVSVGDSEAASQIREALSEPDAFIARGFA